MGRLLGAPFGACQNAYTTFDRTVYTLHVPTDKEGLVEESLKLGEILSVWHSWTSPWYISQKDTKSRYMPRKNLKPNNSSIFSWLLHKLNMLDCRAVQEGPERVCLLHSHLRDLKKTAGSVGPIWTPGVCWKPALNSRSVFWPRMSWKTQRNTTSGFGSTFGNILKKRPWTMEISLTHP